MRIAIATDAWLPQVNGVVRTYQQLIENLCQMGHEILLITPNEFKTMPCPTYPEIRLAVTWAGSVGRKLEKFDPDFVHIATEGPIGLSVRRYCVRENMGFTTSFHTRFPEYVSARFPVPISWGYRLQKWFHNSGKGMMVSTRSLADELRGKGFTNIYPWSRGVNTELYRPRKCRQFGTDKAVLIYVGRVAVEKNIESFLKLEFEFPIQKVVVGDGPQLSSLRQAYPDVIFTGAKHGEELAEAYSSSDVFVFPSLTDTFGIVLIEAMASGLPVAAFPVTGPIDVVENGVTGVLDEDLGKAVRAALLLDRNVCRDKAMCFSWSQCAEQFLAMLESAHQTKHPDVHEQRQKAS